MKENLNEVEKAMLGQARYLDQLSEDIRAEAKARILQKVPEYKQRNLLMVALQLLMQLKQAGQLTKAEKLLWAKVQSDWCEIDTIRQISNELEHRAEEGNLPRNWRQDRCWQRHGT